MISLSIDCEANRNQKGWRGGERDIKKKEKDQPRKEQPLLFFLYICADIIIISVLNYIFFIFICIFGVAGYG